MVATQSMMPIKSFWNLHFNKYQGKINASMQTSKHPSPIVLRNVIHMAWAPSALNSLVLTHSWTIYPFTLLPCFPQIKGNFFLKKIPKNKKLIMEVGFDSSCPSYCKYFLSDPLLTSQQTNLDSPLACHLPISFSCLPIWSPKTKRKCPGGGGGSPNLSWWLDSWLKSLEKKKIWKKHAHFSSFKLH